MLRNILTLAACFCFLSAPLAMADNTYQRDAAVPAGQYSQSHGGMCFTGPNGTGEPINWVKNEMQCANQSTGQSWIGDSGARNYIKDH